MRTLNPDYTISTFNSKPLKSVDSFIYLHWPNDLSVLQRSARPGFNPKSSYTKDSKNGT